MAAHQISTDFQAEAQRLERDAKAAGWHVFTATTADGSTSVGFENKGPSVWGNAYWTPGFPFEGFVHTATTDETFDSEAALRARLGLGN